MHAVSLSPTTTRLRLTENSTVSECRGDDRFSILRVESTGPMGERVRKSSSVPAILVSVSLSALAAGDYRLWVNDQIVPTGQVPAFRTHVIDLAAEPVIWAGKGLQYVHFHVRRAVIDGAAADLGHTQVGSVRLSVLENDIVLAQIAKSVLPYLGGARQAQPLALDHVELILGAHILQHYGTVRQRRAVVGGGLAAWQRRRAEELLRENLDGRVRLADLARECGLSVSHFARGFKASLGVTSHQWLTERRIERAKMLLAGTTASLADVATQSGFGDQAAFTRTFHRLVGVTPGRWRREHAHRAIQ